MFVDVQQSIYFRNGLPCKASPVVRNAADPSWKLDLFSVTHMVACVLHMCNCTKQAVSMDTAMFFHNIATTRHKKLCQSWFWFRHKKTEWLTDRGQAQRLLSQTFDRNTCPLGTHKWITTEQHLCITKSPNNNTKGNIFHPRPALARTSQLIRWQASALTPKPAKHCAVTNWL